MQEMPRRTRSPAPAVCRCEKTARFDYMRSLKKMHGPWLCVCKGIVNLPPALVIVVTQLWEMVQMAMSNYENFECACSDTGNTIRLGSSWISNTAAQADIANLEDLEESL